MLYHDGMIIDTKNHDTDKIVAQMQTKDGKYYYKIFANRLIQTIFSLEPYMYFDDATPSFSNQLGLNGFKHLLCDNNTFKNLRMDCLLHMFIDRSIIKNSKDPEILPGVFRIIRMDDTKEKIWVPQSVFEITSSIKLDDILPYIDFYEKLLLTRERKLGDIPFINSPKEPNNGDGR